jgi:hypothetical protein
MLIYTSIGYLMWILDHWAVQGKVFMSWGIVGAALVLAIGLFSKSQSVGKVFYMSHQGSKLAKKLEAIIVISEGAIVVIITAELLAALAGKISVPVATPWVWNSWELLPLGWLFLIWLGSFNTYRHLPKERPEPIKPKELKKMPINQLKQTVANQKEFRNLLLKSVNEGLNENHLLAVVEQNLHNVKLELLSRQDAALTEIEIYISILKIVSNDDELFREELRLDSIRS